MNNVRLALIVIILCAIVAGAQRLTTTQPTVVCDTNTLSTCATVTAGNAVKVDGSAATQPISGNVGITGTPTVQPGNTANTTPWLVNQTASASVTTTMQNGATGVGNGTVLNVDGMASAHVTGICTVSCTMATTFTLEAQNDASNFVAVYGIQDNSNTIASAFSLSTTTPIGVTVPLNGLKQLRARISTYGNGTITIIGTASPAAGNLPPVVNATIPANTQFDLNRVLGQPVVVAAAGIQKVAIVDSMGGNILATTDPCSGSNVANFTVATTAANTPVLLVSATAGQTGYICGIHIHGNTANDVVVSVVEGTQTTNPCDSGTPTAIDGNTTASNGFRIAGGGGGFTTGFGGATVYKTPSANRQLCGTASTTDRVVWSGTFIKQ